jgi:hypothetical protein
MVRKTAAPISRVGARVRMADASLAVMSGRFAGSRIASTRIRVDLLALAILSIGYIRGHVAAPVAERETSTIVSASASAAEHTAPMTVTVVPRSESGVFRDTALVYLDGPIDAGAPDRLSRALDGIDGKLAVWLNSPGGNLFAGMQLGRIIRKHGAATHIIDYHTLLPGECYRACSLAFLDGEYRFADNGARYGVHRASLQTGPTPGARDLEQALSGSIRSYIREMGVDARLFDLWVKAGADEMYLLSQQQARDLGVVNNGRKPPEWSIAAFPGGTLLQGRQTTADGAGMIYFSCDGKQTVLGSVYEAAGTGDAITAREWSHWLTIDGDEIPFQALGVSTKDGAVRSTFLVPPNLVRLAMSARQIGHLMKPNVHHRLAIASTSTREPRRWSGISSTDAFEGQHRNEPLSARVLPSLVSVTDDCRRGAGVVVVARLLYHEAPGPRSHAARCGRASFTGGSDS